MKQLIVLVILIFISGFSFGQTPGYYSRGYYTPNYTPMILGSNGFRSVEDENRLMDQMIAQRRRERAEEERTAAEIAREQKRIEDEKTAKRSAFGNKERAAAPAAKK